MYKLTLLFLFIFVINVSSGASVSKSNNNNCDSVNSVIRNISRTIHIQDYPSDGAHLKICTPLDGKTCCSNEMEELFRLEAKKDFKSTLHEHTAALEDTLTQSASQIHDQIKEMIIKSKNKTLTVFNDVYESIIVETNDLITQFYSQIIDFIAIDANKNRQSNKNRHTFDSIVPKSRSSIHKPSLENDNLPGGADADTVKQLNDNSLSDLPNVETINIDSSKIETLSLNLNNFFNNLFPIIYKNIILNNKSFKFSSQYDECLVNLINNINPYNNINKLITKELIKNLKSVKILFNSVFYGIRQLHRINEIIHDNLNSECLNVLTRMRYCATCSSFGGAADDVVTVPRVKPCANYCVNGVNACLVSGAGEFSALNLCWTSYLQSMVNIVQAIQYGQSNVNIEDVVYSLHSRISETIMYAMQQANNIDKKVRYACGPPKFLESSTDATATSTEISTSTMQPSKSIRTLIWHDLDDYSMRFNEQLAQFHENIEKYKTFYTSLGERICDVDGTSRQTGQCWNGRTLGTYMKAVVPASMSSQKYNPELTWTPSSTPDPKLTQILDGLKHTRQILSQLTFSSEPESHVVLEEGSGSGGGRAGSVGRGEFHEYDDEDMDWKDQGSGSGDGRTGLLTPDLNVTIGEPNLTRNDTNVNSTDSVNSVPSLSSSMYLGCVLVVVNVLIVNRLGPLS